ncbi:MAG TPA: S53 family peptidase [Solirubrobacteraceae bacterium]|nr:S53 family peptidase [Solirubrobacteraceae bacterium]
MINRIATRTRLGPPTRLLPFLLLITCCVSAGLGWSAAASAAPPAPSAYTVRGLCANPSPGRSGCLGLQLVAKDPRSVPGTRVLPAATTGARRATSAPRSEAFERKIPWPESLTPANLLAAYSLTGVSPPSTQTIGIVDAYDDATVEADLAHFNAQYGLPPCTEGNGCFRKVNQAGDAAPLPSSSGEEERGWALEIATDVEVAHGVCPDCRILLVEADSNENSDLYAAEQTAAALGATEISNSWGGEEPEEDSPAFDHPGVVITASSGDAGYLNWLSEEQPASANYPASSPRVIAVGGTRLELNEAATARESETVWNDGGEAEGVLEGAGASGGGCSEAFTAPPWQQAVSDWSFVGCGSARAVADISADADPYTGVAVYDSTETEGESGWWMIGGTSVASPIIAATFALAGGAQGVEYPARTLYENAAKTHAPLHDVRAGSNGECLLPFKAAKGLSGCSAIEEAESCEVQAICLAVNGYDGPTGVGTSDGVGAFLATGVGGEAPTPPVATQARPVIGASLPGATRPPAAIVSALRLTRRAIAALSRRHPRIGNLGFSFASARRRESV